MGDIRDSSFLEANATVRAVLHSPRTAYGLCGPAARV